MWKGGLTSVTIPNNVTSIGEDAFCDCIALTSVTIPNSVTSIGDDAFANCRGLTSVTIPDSVTSIECSAFEGCSGLRYISVATGNARYSSSNGLLLTKDGTTLFQGVNGAVTIPHGVTSIGGHAFAGCSGLTGVTIPAGVTSIGSSAFSGCRGLTNVTMPDSVTGIGEGAFENCSGLTSMTIPASVTSIGWEAFWGCSGLKELRVPKAWESKYVDAWGSTTHFWSDWACVPSGCEIIYYEPGDSGEALAVPIDWIDKNAAAILAVHEGDYAAAANAIAANGMRVWECYLAGLSPTDTAAAFKVKSIEFVDGKVVVTWEPDLNEGETKKARSYVVEGAETLGGGWGEPNAASRFFRVKVALP